MTLLEPKWHKKLSNIGENTKILRDLNQVQCYLDTMDQIIMGARFFEVCGDWCWESQGQFFSFNFGNAALWSARRNGSLLLGDYYYCEVKHYRWIGYETIGTGNVFYMRSDDLEGSNHLMRKFMHKHAFTLHTENWRQFKQLDQSQVDYLTTILLE